MYKDKTTYEGKIEYFDTVRVICKELMEEQDYATAQQLYSRVLGEFKNIPKKIRDALTEEQADERTNIQVILNTNLALCSLKRDNASKAVEYSKEGIKLNAESCKAHYFLAKAYK